MANSSVETVDRLARLLSALAASGSHGATLPELVDATGLSRATAHRLLASCQEAGFTYQDLESRRYRLGSVPRLFGIAAREQFAVSLGSTSLARLAASSGDTVMCSVLEGSAAVCVDRAVGDFPVKTLTLSPGDRRPLGVGAGSLALLAALPDPLVETAITRNETWLTGFGSYTPRLVRSLVARTRTDGFALNEGHVVAEMSAVAVVVRGPGDSPVAALSIAAIRDRMTPTRRLELVAMLRDEAELLERQLARTDDPTDRTPQTEPTPAQTRS